jgi:hypothetical protein
MLKALSFFWQTELKFGVYSKLLLNVLNIENSFSNPAAKTTTGLSKRLAERMTTTQVASDN